MISRAVLAPRHPIFSVTAKHLCTTTNKPPVTQPKKSLYNKFKSWYARNKSDREELFKKLESMKIQPVVSQKNTTLFDEVHTITKYALSNECVSFLIKFQVEVSQYQICTEDIKIVAEDIKTAAEDIKSAAEDIKTPKFLQILERGLFDTIKNHSVRNILLERSQIESELLKNINLLLRKYNLACRNLWILDVCPPPDVAMELERIAMKNLRLDSEANKASVKE